MNKDQAKIELLRESRSLSKETNKQFKFLSEDYGPTCELGYERGYTAGYQDCIDSAIEKLCPESEPDQSILLDELEDKLMRTYFGPPEIAEMMDWIRQNFTLIRK